MGRWLILRPPRLADGTQGPWEALNPGHRFERGGNGGGWPTAAPRRGFITSSLLARSRGAVPLAPQADGVGLARVEREQFIRRDRRQRGREGEHVRRVEGRWFDPHMR